MRGPPRIRPEPGRAAGRRGRARPPFPRALVGIPRTSARPSCRLPSSLHVNVNPPVLEADRVGGGRGGRRAARPGWAGRGWGRRRVRRWQGGAAGGGGGGGGRGGGG